MGGAPAGAPPLGDGLADDGLASGAGVVSGSALLEPNLRARGAGASFAVVVLAFDGVTRPDVRPPAVEPLVDFAVELDDFLEVVLAAPVADLARPPDLAGEAGSFFAVGLAAGLAGLFLADPPLAAAPPATAFLVV